MFRHLAAAALSALILAAAAPASAQKPPPDAARIRTAAEQFDSGLAAFKQKEFEAAASRFEAADAAVPSSEALRQAIRARSEAGQGSRAATLAALAIERYPSDAKVYKTAHDALEKFEPLLHKVSVSCVSPCVLAVGIRSVPGDANTRWVVYLDPGKEVVSASFFGGSRSAQREIKATAGGSIKVRFDPEEKAAPAVAPPIPPPVPDKPPPKDAPIDDKPPTEEPKSKGIPIPVFVVGVVATAGLGGVTIWSGLDTIKNPGVETVKKACAGKGETCPEYQAGRSKQFRTNILIGATAGTAAVTTVIAILTNWRGSKKKPASAAIPFVTADDRGALLGADGTF